MQLEGKNDERFLLCNICSCGVDGIAYRSSCRHFFCPQCAIKSFQRGTSCTVCSQSLGNGEVNEINVGLLNSDISILDMLFQYTLQSTSWDSILRNAEKLSAEIIELNAFIFSQLCVQISRSSKAATDFQREQLKLKEKTVELTERVHELEGILENSAANWEKAIQQKNRDMTELQEAFKEKQRKCHAWEKAYNNIRGQVLSSGVADTTFSDLNEGNVKRSFRRTEVQTYRRSLNDIPKVIAPSETWSKMIGRTHSSADELNNYPGEIPSLYSGDDSMLHAKPQDIFNHRVFGASRTEALARNKSIQQPTHRKDQDPQQNMSKERKTFFDSV